MTPIEQAYSQGYTPDEVNSYLATKRQEAKAAGYTDAEISKYVKEEVTQQPDFNQTPIKTTANHTLAGSKSPTTLREAIATGWGWSTFALGSEMLKGPDGKLPEMAVSDDTPLALRAVSNLTTLGADVPAMIAGGILGGGPVSPITAAGGAFGLPMGLRKVFIDAIQNNEIGGRKDFADRVTGTMWETAKGWITGAATAGAGKLATEAVSGLPAFAKSVLPTTAELATLTEVSARLEGHTPEPQALLDNAIVLGVAKAVLPAWAPAKTILHDTYVKTGIHPEQVTQDALRGDKNVWQDTLDGRVPDAYKDQVETPPSPPTQTQRTEGLKSDASTPQTPSTGFTTAKGSTYTVDADSRTTRNKAARPEHPGPKERGPQPTSEHTFYVDQAALDKLAEFQTQGGPRKQIAALGDGRYGIRYTEGKDAGKFEARTVVHVESTPKVGLYPVELWTEGKRVHFGNMITEVSGGTSQTRPVTGPKGPAKERRVPPLTPEQQAQARAFLDQPFAEIPQMPNEPSRPTHVNYNRIQTTDDAAGALAQLSTIYEAKIKEQQKSPRSWAKSQQDSAQVLADLLQSDPATVSAFLKGETAGPSTTAQLLARKELTLGFTEDLMRSRAGLVAKGDAATPEELATFLAKVERVSNVQAAFLGQRADVGRALNALKSTKREADRAQAIIDALDTYGGPENVGKLVKLLGEYDNPTQAIKFSKEATKATSWEMLVEAWKAGLVSGLRTNEVNFLSTAAFTTLRLPTEAIAATIGAIKGHEDRVLFSEIPARVMGMAAGVRDGLTAAGAVLRTGDNLYGPKTESFEPKIPGKTGEIVRLPFRALSASDVLMKTINERSELYALSTRQAMTEGRTFGEPEFFRRVSEIAANPPQEMTDAAHDAALRYTFNKPLGPGGKSFAHTVRAWHLEWMFPFITTPGNIFKETARMTPGVNLAVKEWRQAYETGGVKRDQALAEVAVGTAIMSSVVMGVLDGTLTGNGQPDKRMRATDRAAGWKPYAVKINGQYVDGYLRMAPIGPLIGLAADGAEFFQYMTHDERDQWSRMLAFAFASNVTNQTFMTGATNFVNVLQDPSRYGQNYFESLAGSLVPSIIGQIAADMDPLVREIHGMRDAMMARIPGQREGLLPKRDLFGKPIESPERLWLGSPFSVSAASTDKVRQEASRIGFATPDIPKSLDVIPGKDLKSLDKIQLTPEQKDVFASRSGQQAYEVLSKEVNKPEWDSHPDMVKRMIYEKAMHASRTKAQKEMLDMVIRQSPALVKEVETKASKAMRQ